MFLFYLKEIKQSFGTLLGRGHTRVPYSSSCIPFPQPFLCFWVLPRAVAASLQSPKDGGVPGHLAGRGIFLSGKADVAYELSKRFLLRLRIAAWRKNLIPFCCTYRGEQNQMPPGEVSCCCYAGLGTRTWMSCHCSGWDQRVTGAGTAQTQPHGITPSSTRALPA